MTKARAKVNVKNTKSARSRRLTLQNLLADGSEIWVRNNSGVITGREAGNIVLQVGSGNMVDSVMIPPGNDPVCLTDQVTPGLLKECMDLFKLVRTEALILLDPDDAENYYEQNKARKVAMEEKIARLLNEEKAGASLPKQPTTSNVEIHPKVGDICLKARHGAITEKQALERAIEQQSVLTLDDYHYLSMNGVFTKLKQWAKDEARMLMRVPEDDPVEAAMAK